MYCKKDFSQLPGHQYYYNEKNGIKVFLKDVNSPNCPEQRAIESYWALVKGILLKSNKSAKDDKKFKQKWVAASKMVTESKIHAMMALSLKKFSKHPLKSVRTD